MVYSMQVKHKVADLIDKHGADKVAEAIGCKVRTIEIQRTQDRNLISEVRVNRAERKLNAIN